ncbi:TldD/PmbA family protein [bacterium]|nr:TldD/PmbA family protein [bacterium]
MLSKLALTQVLKTALANGGDFAEVFIEEKKTIGISCEENKIEVVSSGTDSGVGLRLIFKDKTFYASTSELTKESLIKTAKTLSKGISGRPKKIKINLQPAKANVNFKIRRLPSEVKIEEKVRIVKEANKRARSIDKRIKQVMVGYGDSIKKITIANSNGTLAEDEKIQLLFSVTVVVKEKGILQTGTETKGGFIGWEIFGEFSPEAIATIAAKRAILMLEAQKAPAGEMTVVLSSSAGGTMIHEAIGHGLEADIIQKGASKYCGKMDKKIASSLITVIDDSTLPNKRGSYRFDDEGNPSQKTILVKGGILKSYLYDYLTATKDKIKPTGNGRRESCHYRPIPRMSNTYIAPGKDNPEEIIKSTRKGLFVKKMGGGQVDSVNGDFVFEVEEGYLIEDGKVTEPVRGATLIGNGPEILREIDMVGNDLGFEIGTCGKEGQGVPISDGQPTLRIPKIIVGGTRK